MRYADSDTPIQRFPDHIRPILDAMVKNRRTFSETDDAPLVTEAIRYQSRKQKRMSPSDREIEDSTLQAISELFDFQPLEFQLEAWDQLSSVLGQSEPDETAALVTAPTGFGKTEAFLGPLLNGIADGHLENIALVYPRTALLRDQLSRILQVVHQLNNDRNCDISVGPYYGDIPFYSYQVDDHYQLVNKYTGELRIADCWCTGDNDISSSYYLEGEDDNYSVTCDGPEEHQFNADELVLAKERMRFDPPNVFVTTLQSLENACFKPNYNILDELDAIVVDEIHLYNGIYGSHASRIFRNIQRIKRELDGEEPLFIGSSATLDSPERFAKKMLDVERDQVLTFEPRKNRDFKPDSEVSDFENYYFVLSSEETSLASTFTQQSMLFGHSLLQPAGSNRRNKMLSFIDSVSSVNQKAIQFRDADQNRQLWQYHRGLNNEDWDDVATQMGYEFIEKPLQVETDHSDIALSSSDIRTSDFLISTATMEVGIDIGSINVVSQYHAPFRLSNFVQRAGRAGRKEGDSHIVTFLNRDDTDKNLFNRADRFLDQEITTPLNPNNKIVEWVHNSLYAYYMISRENGSEREFMRALFTEDHPESLPESVGYDEFYDFLQQPQQFVSELLDTNVQNLFNERPVHSLTSSLSTVRDEMQAEIRPIATELQGDIDDFLNAGDPSGEILSELQTRALTVAREYEDRIESLEQVYGQTSETSKLGDRISNIKNEHEDLKLSVDTDKLQEEYRKLQMEFREIDNRTVQLCYSLASGEPELTFDLGTDSLDRFERLLNAMAQGPQDRLDAFRNRWQATYYLKECLENLKEYHATGGKSHESAHAVKFLLRSLYFFDQYLEKRDEVFQQDEHPEDIPVYYVPEKYFDPSGSTFTLIEHVDDPEEEDGERMSEEPLYSVISQYYPYRTHFNQSGEMEVFQPPTVDTGSGREFDFAQFQGTREAGYVSPDSIPLKKVADCSGSSGQMILNYCPICFEILPHSGADCPRHDRSQFGKLFSEPRVSGEILDFDDQGEALDENLTLGDFTMQLQLESVEITEYEYNYTGDSFFPVNRDNPNRETISLPESQKIGIQLDTRGLIWDLDAVADEKWLEAVQDRINEFRRDQTPLNEKELTERRHHTAAHLLMLVVADVAGVKTDMLRYHIDDRNHRVIVYEEAEGGQGIVDLAAHELLGKPAKFLNSLLRVSYDPSVINRQCWASDTFIADLESLVSSTSLRALDRDHLKDPVETTLESDLETTFFETEFEVVNDELLENVTQDVLSYIDKLDSINDATGGKLDDTEMIEIGFQAATAILDGKAAAEGVDLEGIDDSQINNLLGKPRPDGCIDTLHIQDCSGERGDTEQADCLSHVLLQTLRQQLVESTSDYDLYEHIDETETLPATVNEDGSRYYISF